MWLLGQFLEIALVIGGIAITIVALVWGWQWIFGIALLGGIYLIFNQGSFGATMLAFLGFGVLCGVIFGTGWCINWCVENRRWLWAKFRDGVRFLSGTKG